MMFRARLVRGGTKRRVGLMETGATTWVRAPDRACPRLQRRGWNLNSSSSNPEHPTCRTGHRWRSAHTAPLAWPIQMREPQPSQARGTGHNQSAFAVVRAATPGWSARGACSVATMKESEAMPILGRAASARSKPRKGAADLRRNPLRHAWHGAVFAEVKVDPISVKSAHPPCRRFRAGRIINPRLSQSDLRRHDLGHYCIARASVIDATRPDAQRQLADTIPVNAMCEPGALMVDEYDPTEPRIKGVGEWRHRHGWRYRQRGLACDGIRVRRFPIGSTILVSPLRAKYATIDTLMIAALPANSRSRRFKNAFPAQ